MCIAELGLEGNIPSLLCGDGTIVGLLVDPCQILVFVPLMTIVLEIMAPSWAISDVLAHQIFAPTWEKLVILDQI
jgi:hypothetical protein